MEEPHRFDFTYTAGATDQTYTAVAHADLDCDGAGASTVTLSANTVERPARVHHRPQRQRRFLAPDSTLLDGRARPPAGAAVSARRITSLLTSTTVLVVDVTNPMRARP